MKLFVLFNLIFLLPLISRAESVSMTLYGKLLSFTSSTATIKTENGAQVIVPRESVSPNVEGVLVGRGMVQASIDMQQLLSLNPKINDTYKQKRKPSSNKNP